MAIRKIEITNDNPRYYRISPRTIVFGRLYDNEADTIQIVRPAGEADSVCTLIFTDVNGEVIDHVVMTSDEWKITSNVSQYANVQFGFSFARQDGYIKNSEIGTGQFLPALKPDDFVPVAPDQQANLDYLIGHGFTAVKLEGNDLNFYNLKNDLVGTVKIEGIDQEQADLAETDDTQASYIKNKKVSLLENDCGYVDKNVDNLANYYLKTEVDTQIKKINSVKIRNTEAHKVIEATDDTVQAVATKYIQDNYGREPEELDGLYITFTDHENDVIEYDFFNGFWQDTGRNGVDLTDYASLTEENTFEGKQNFNGETEFNSNAEHNANINVHEHTVNVTDTASDSVAKYGAKSVIVDQGGNDPKEVNLPNKAGTFARLEDINEKVGFKYAKLENVDTETAKEDAIITEDIDAAIGMYHRNGTSQAGFIAQKNFAEQNAVDTTEEGKTTQANVNTANGAAIVNAQDSDGNKSTMTVTPESITFNKTPMVNGSELGSIPTITGTEENPIILYSLEKDKYYYLQGKWAIGTAYSTKQYVEFPNKTLFKWARFGSDYAATFYGCEVVFSIDRNISFAIQYNAGSISRISSLSKQTGYDMVYDIRIAQQVNRDRNINGFYQLHPIINYFSLPWAFPSDAKSISYYFLANSIISFSSNGYIKVGSNPNKYWYLKSDFPLYAKCSQIKMSSGTSSKNVLTFLDVKLKETTETNELPLEYCVGSTVNYVMDNSGSLSLVTKDDELGSAGGSLIQGINGKTVADGTQDYWNEAAMFYAPTESGTSGQLLQSNGANKAPTWVNNPALAKAAESVVSAVYVRDAEGNDTTKSYSFSAEGDTIVYRNASGRTQVATPVADDDAVNKAYADKFEQKYLSLTGESGTLDDSQYALVTGYDNLIIQRVGLQFTRCGYPSNGQGNYTFVSPYYAKPNGTEEWADYYITVKQDKTWEATIKNHISVSEQTYPSVVELTPNTAVNGTLSDDNFSYLTEHDDVKIKLNGEYYILMDDEHTEGIVSYIHEGWNGNSNQVKSINITLATKAWTLVIGKNKYYRHYIQLSVGDKTIYYDFSSTQDTAYTADTLPAMPDDIITAFQIVAGGYYSSVSGLVYRNSENALKVILHGMFTTDGATMTYLQLAGSDATFVKDTVKTM